jgi:hypothetical protein
MKMLEKKVNDLSDVADEPFQAGCLTKEQYAELLARAKAARNQKKYDN